MTNLKTDMGLENFSYSYFPNFCIRNEERYEEFAKTVEYLKIIRKDLEGLLYLLKDREYDFNKASLIRYLSNIIESMLVDIKEVRAKELDMPLDNLNLKVSDDYIMFSVYSKYHSIYESLIPKPLIVVMSRSLKDLEFYFIEKVEQKKPYVFDAYYVADYKVNSEEIKMYSGYVLNYDFIKEKIVGDTEACIQELKKVLR